MATRGRQPGCNTSIERNIFPRAMSLCRPGCFISHGGWRKCADQPTLAWWVARQPGPPFAIVGLAYVEDRGCGGLAGNCSYPLAHHLGICGDPERPSQPIVVFTCGVETKRSDWTSSVLRAFQKASEPTFKIKSPGGTARAKPPPKSWSDTEWRQIAEVDIEFPDMHRDEVEIPEEVLPEVFAILQWNLARTVERLLECQKTMVFVSSHCTKEMQIDETIFLKRMPLSCTSCPYWIECPISIRLFSRVISKLGRSPKDTFFDKLRPIRTEKNRNCLVLK